MSAKRYIYWNRNDFFEHFKRQSKDFDIDINEIEKIVFDKNWQPINEFNGCNFVQDDLHPFYPCFKHDYNWIVNKGGNKYDLEFKDDLITFGFSKFRAWCFYFGVRLGWLFWYKWKK